MRIAVTLDCADPDLLASFWAPALGYERANELGPYVVLAPSDWRETAAPIFILQQVPESKAGKNRMHVDLHGGAIDAEVDRLVGLGATRVDSELFGDSSCTWVVMSDPEGNEFCVCYAPGDPA